MSGEAGDRAAGGVSSPAALNWYAALVCVVVAVNDGWSGRPSPLGHQLVLLPFTCVFVIALVALLRARHAEGSGPVHVSRWFVLAGVFEALSFLSFFYERRHFARFGYGFGSGVAVAAAVVIAVAAAWAVVRRNGAGVLAGGLVMYAAGLLLAVRSFPLNYLRSDMLPVIEWADQRLVAHLNPYTTMHVGTRLYDFPYLPGMLVAYFAPIALGVDPRLLNLACLCGCGALVYAIARAEARLGAALLFVVFLLSPFLQYRHDLYLAPHWFTVVLAVALMQRRHFVCAAVAWGVSMALYQLSWILFPFFLLNALRRRGWGEASKLTLVGIGSALVVVGPFLSSAAQRIASNTVGQWSRLPHALADPINLSYWLTYLVRPDRLTWVQAVEMVVIFGVALVRGRCGSLTDTLRWMSGALALFIASNVLVDGYFYLTLLVLVLLYTLAVTGLWVDLEMGAELSSGRSFREPRAG